MVITVKGMFDNTDTLVEHFNELMSTNNIKIRVTYTVYLYEAGVTKFEFKLARLSLNLNIQRALNLIINLIFHV